MGFRRKFYLVRILILLTVLLAVAIWRAQVLRDESRRVDWTSYHQVLICPIVGPGAVYRPIGNRLTEAETALSAWMADEFERWTRRDTVPVLFRFADPVGTDAEPPRLPPPGASFFERWRGVSRFLSFFQQHERLFPAPWPHATRIYLYVHAAADEAAYFDRHSVGTRRGRLGIVFASDDPARWGNTQCVIAHETLHTVGAVDHRDRAGNIAYPAGYAEPDRQPRYPQDKAEVMALGIPRNQTDEWRVRTLDDIVIGRWTAADIGWAGLPPP